MSVKTESDVKETSPHTMGIAEDAKPYTKPTLGMEGLAQAVLDEAQKQGVPVEKDVEEVLSATLKRAEVPAEDPLIRLMEKWIDEDTTDDPEEMQRREAEWQTLKVNLEENRLSLPIPEV